jgi:hypothetical protein
METRTVAVPECILGVTHEFEVKKARPDGTGPTIPAKPPVQFYCEVGQCNVKLIFYYGELKQEGCKRQCSN